jgi:integrase
MRTGCVEQMASGRWRVRMKDCPGGKLKTLETYDTEVEARACCASFAIAVQKSEEAHEGMTVRELGKAVLTERELRGAISDPGTDWSRFRKHIDSDRIATMAVRTLGNGTGQSLVEDWLERLDDKGVARGVRIHCKNLLSVIMHRAIRKRLAKANPCLGVKFERDKRTEDPWTFASLEEQAALIDATPAPLDAIVEFAIGTGLRSGELVSLRLVDVHLKGDNPFITVRYGGPPSGRHPNGTPVKWGKMRDVRLFGHGLRALERWLAGLPAYCPDNPHGLAFPGAHGGYRAHDHVFRWAVWKGSPQKGKRGDVNFHAATTGILERAGIERDFRWHDLRHTCASSLVSGWWGPPWTLKEVCEHLGHKSITTTERYAHLSDTALKRAARGAHAGFAEGGLPFHAVPCAVLPSSDSSTISSERDTSLELATFGLGSRRSTN